MIDEDFEEIMKEQTQYIEELEAELAEYKHVASAIDTQWAESQDEIADLKDKLDLAVVYLRRIERLSLHYTQPEKLEGLYRHAHGTTRHIAQAAIAELTGGKDD